jgi:N6-L-threonylcarbamoyladenine synthase
MPRAIKPIFFQKHVTLPAILPFMPSLILAIESSCDETAAAVLFGQKLLGESIASQAIHEAYGGVVPELAARAHHRHIVPVIQEAIGRAGIQLKQVDAVAYTQGPGLMGGLLVGAGFAKGLAYALGAKLVGVHHVRAHLLANFLEEEKPSFPFLGLVVSGGHTQLLWAESASEMDLLGETQDDAVGEAFDKIAKLLGYSYPGGHWIDKQAAGGESKAFTLPRAKMPGLDFSFSGIKTAVRYLLQKAVSDEPNFVVRHEANLCASVQEALVGMLVDKVKKAITLYQPRQLVLGGGVAANSSLRAELADLAKERGLKFFVPPLRYCTDNAAMIGIAAHFQLQAGATTPFDAPSYPRCIYRKRKRGKG